MLTLISGRKKSASWPFSTSWDRPMMALSSLTSDTMSVITSFLKVGSILSLGATSKTMHSIVTGAVLWEDLCIRDFRINPHSFPRTATGWLQLYKNMKAPIVLTWGENGNGRLRQPDQPSWGRVRSPTPIDTTDIGPIAAMACTGWGMHALNQKGDVWFWGALDEYSIQTTGSRVPLPEPCRSICGGRSYGCALGDSGAAYVWTSARNAYSAAKFTVQVTNCTPTEDCRHVKAKAIAAGWSHVALLLADGSIKTCHVETIHSIAQTKAFSIASDPRDPIDRLVAGCDFTVALSKRGLVYLWHEIGQPPTSESLHFDTNDKLGLHGARFSHMSARLHHLALVDGATGRLRMFDLNRGREITSTWMDSTREIAKVSHGDWHGGALLTNGQVWTWGNGSCALGLGTETQRQVDEPQQIHRGLEGLFVFDIAFGGWHSAALAFRI
ncbi:hypothetical protein H310_11435 [Aphanomyces invadans]|uniref:F-box domain-containing protein n=1 Tax=Aphanomyces invadans TaxID=157072 RepID=A0A024TP72_9STRA|nr:hypothetical protein H310_11435 [Aphanomyces invadans]ETV95172.1 hypothetical protein H310_11435 [Aphanomyces invadans]|eukprot:XP_008876345.1 hypothetical protein H310_11435 [Aphanomyces invadans]